MKQKTWHLQFSVAELAAWKGETKLCPSCKRLLPVIDCFGLIRKPYKNRTRICARAYCSRCDSRIRRERFRRNNPEKWETYLQRFRQDADLNDPVKRRVRIDAWKKKNRIKVLGYYRTYRERFKDRY